MSRIDALTEGAGPAGLSWRGWIALALIALFALTPGITSVPVMDRDEARYSQASRQMMETGDFIDIRFQDAPRHVKPAGIYWMQALAAQPFGGEDAPVAAHRLPSLIGAFLAALGTAWFAARAFGARAGLAAGLIMAGCLALQIEARTAKTDAMLLLTAVMAQGALFMMLARKREPSAATQQKAESREGFWGWPAVFWAATGAALMIKGPIVTMVSALTLVVFAVLQRRGPGAILKPLRVLPGLILTAAIALPWVIAITIATDGAFLQESVGHALLGKVGEADDSHGGPFLYHTLLSPATLWPGAVLLPLAAIVAWTRRKEPEIAFLIAWALPTWIVFELVQTKLPHYVMPVFPALAMLAAVGLLDPCRYIKSLPAKIAHGVFGALVLLVGLVLAAAPLGVRLFEFDAGMEPWALIALAVGVLAAFAALWLALRPTLARLAGAVLAAAAFYTAAFGFAIPAVDAMWPSDRAGRIVAQLEGCEAYPAATAGYREPSNVFHLGTEVNLTDGADAAAHLSENAECGVAVVDASEREAFDAALAEAGLSTRSLGQVEGTNLVKGRELSLEILTLEGSDVRAD